MEWIYDAKITRQLEAIFERDLEQCREVTLKDVALRRALAALPQLVRAPLLGRDLSRLRYERDRPGAAARRQADETGVF